MSFSAPTIQDLENRFNYHAPFGDQALRYNEIRSQIRELAHFIVVRTPISKEQALCLNALDQVMFLANASIARNEKPV